MDNRVGPLRVILLALLTVLILAIFAGAGLYLRDSMLMREGDINYNAGDYNSALARYKVLQDTYLFKQEAFQKADYCNYNLAREAMENEQWEEAKGYLNEVKSSSKNATKASKLRRTACALMTRSSWRIWSGQSPCAWTRMMTEMSLSVSRCS